MSYFFFKYLIMKSVTGRKIGRYLCKQCSQFERKKEEEIERKRETHRPHL